MALSWADVLTEGSKGPRRRHRRLKLLVLVVALAGVAIVVPVLFLYGRSETLPPAAVENAQDEPAVEADGPSLAPEERGLLEAYPRERIIEGAGLIERGEIDAAETWLRNYLEAPTDGRDDQALLALGLVYRVQGKDALAEDALRRLVRVRTDSLRAGDGYYVLGRLLSEAGREGEAERCFLEAARVYSRSRGGALSARRLADRLYEEHVAREPRRGEWERVRDLYSIALPAVDYGDPERARLVERLDWLNQWIVFTAHSRPAEGYPSNLTFHTVKPGETLGGIAKRYGVTVGAVRRLNGIDPGSSIIRPGDELKILRGRAEIVIDKGSLRMTVWLDGRFFREYEVGVGAKGKTPSGRFKIATRLVDPDWSPPGEELIPFGDPRNILGTRWLGFGRRGPGRGIGIHGSILKDGAWQGVGGRISNGCIRMRNPDVEELYDFAVTGTEVTILD